jgi:hypothetical protein
MLPKNLALDEVLNPKDFDALIELVETSYRVEHEQTTLESISLKPDGTTHTPAGEWQATRDFLECCAAAIGMPKAYAYKITPELFCENFARRRTETTVPITISRIGEVATGLIVDRKSRYKPARTADVLRAIPQTHGLEFRRASVCFAGVDVEWVRHGVVVEPAVGDVVEIGIAMTNSESGGRQLKASAYSYRLVCTNGAIMADSLGTARWPNDPRMTVGGCMRAFQANVDVLCRKLNGVSSLYTVANERLVPDDELWNAWRRVSYHVPRPVADEIFGMSEIERQDLEHLIRHRDRREWAMPTRWTAYEIHNEITRAAHGRPFRIRRALQELGGELLSRAADWPPKESLN